MKKIAALVGLLLVATVGCGGQQQPTPATPASQASPPAASTSAPAAAAKTPAPAARTPSAESGSAIEAGEAVDTADDEPAATRANTLLAQAMTQAKPEPASAGHWAQGVNYQVLVPAQPTNVAPDKVEVVEVFWYACPHCYALEPFLENWKSKKAPYIQFVQVPVMWGPLHRAHAKLFYTLQALGKEEELHNAVMREIQTNHNMLASNDPIESEQLQMEFARRNGIKEEDFRKAYESFAVETNLQRAEQLTRRYQISGVPTFVINGKYTADVGSAGGQSQIIDLINDLAAREQKKQ